MIKIPEISVLMPIMNSKYYTGNAIGSILNQTFENFELIILDSSDDETSEIIKAFRDKRIIYRYLPGKSIPEVLNAGLEISRSDFIARMDADDISAKNRFEVQTTFLKNRPEIDLVGTNFFYINERGKILYEKKMPEHHNDIEFKMPIEASILHPTILTRKNVFYELNGYDIKYKTEDIDIFLRMLKKGFKFQNIQRALYFYRITEKNSSSIEIINNSQLILGRDYLDNKYAGVCDNNKLYEKNLRMGLLEYYSGDLSEARKHFIRCIGYDKKKLFKIFRYLFFSFLGNGFMKFVRKYRISNFFNRNINIIFGYESRIPDKLTK
jgi:glycosyltransferase involved in cell wall biosynthesis